MKESLTKLQKLDQKTYKKINDRIGIRTVCWENVCSNDGSEQDIFMGNMLLDAVQCEIQRAIEARGYMFSVYHIWPKASLPAYEWGARIFIDPENIIETRDDSPAKTILICYLEALTCHS